MGAIPELRLGPTGWPRLAPETRQQTETQLVFRSPLLQVGRFQARPGERHFRCSGPPGQHVFAFPRSSVRIRHEGGEAFVTDRELVTYYNPHQLYFREVVSPAGDVCDWLSLRPDVVQEVAAEVDPGVEPGSPALFRHASGPCDRDSFLIQRSLLTWIGRGTESDADWLAETAVDLLWRLLRGAASHGRRPPESGAAARRQRLLAEAARERLAIRYHMSDRLDDMARDLGTSVGHLCRVFRRHTGQTLHGHRDELRLRAALDRLGEARPSELAHELGYTSHSHFSAAFRRRFGVTPDWLRRRGTPRELRRRLAERRGDSAA
jgi:AraC-like DNA-binding protein